MLRVSGRLSLRPERATVAFVRMLSCLMLLSLLATTSARAQTAQVLGGRCADSSHTAEEPAESEAPLRIVPRTAVGQANLERRYTCDRATIEQVGGDPSHLRVQFSRGARPETTLAFEGTLKPDDDGFMDTPTAYALGSMDPKPAVGNSYCSFLHMSGKVTSISCGSEIDDGRRRLFAIVSFNASTPSRPNAVP